jgi:DNA-binding transcriptional LysR family regulator
MNLMNSPDLELAALRCLTVLIDERNVTRAAERLGMSQPAVSHALARLRRHFSDPLLVRAGRNMVPTPRAIEIDGIAREVLSAVHRLGAAGRSVDPLTVRARFVVTVPEYFERTLAPRLMERLLREAPNVSVELRAPNLDLARDWLDSGEVDFRLAWIHVPRPESRFGRLPDDKLVCLVREGHPVVGPQLRAPEFFALPHVRPAVAVSGGGEEREVTLEQYIGLPSRNRPGAQRLRLALLAQSFTTILQVVANTDAIATVPDRATWDLDPRLRLRVLRPPVALPPLRGALYWHERNNADPRHRWFRRLLLETARQITRPA